MKRRTTTWCFLMHRNQRTEHKKKKKRENWNFSDQVSDDKYCFTFACDVQPLASRLYINIKSTQTQTCHTIMTVKENDMWCEESVSYEDKHFQ